MADLKISALPASTTPLAGTEVLPIVQSGATKKVSVSDLTAGRAVSARSLTASLGNVTTTEGEIVGNRYAIASSLADVGSNSIARFNNNVNPGLQVLVGITATTYKGFIQGYNSGNVTARELVLNPYGGDVSVGAGNLVVSTSGKGITLPGGITWTSGSGSPEGVVTAPVGSLFSRSDGGAGTSLYVKESGSGNTGWVGK